MVSGCQERIQSHETLADHCSLQGCETCLAVNAQIPLFLRLLVGLGGLRWQERGMRLDERNGERRNASSRGFGFRLTRAWVERDLGDLIVAKKPLRHLGRHQMVYAQSREVFSENR